MTLYIHLQMVGTLLMLLGLSHIFFNRFFGWEQELQTFPCSRGASFLCTTFSLDWAWCLAAPYPSFAPTRSSPRHTEPRDPRRHDDVLVVPPASAVLRLRLAIWRGDRFRTFMHVAFALLWCYVTATYGIAFLTVRS